jgi:uncharacterized protein YdhG (YjbR/CyaY superfamily)
MEKYNSVSEYMAAVPAKSRGLIKELRSIIKNEVPDGEELISYGMPAFRWNGMLVWYAVNKEHLGLYPTPSAITKFSQELKAYKTSKGAIQLPLDQPLPVGLIKNIIRFRMEENLVKTKAKQKKGHVDGLKG